MSAGRIFGEYAFSMLAGQSTEIRATGRAWRITDSNAPFSISFDNSKPALTEQGMGASFDETFQSVQLIAPAAQSISGRILIAAGVLQDNRVSFTSGAGLNVNQLAFFGVPLQRLNNTLTVSGGLTPSRSIIAALDTNIEWVMVQNRGASQLAVSNASGETDGAVILDPGEVREFRTGGVMWITNISATVAGAYSALYGERA